MQAVHKYSLEITDLQTIKVARGWQPVKVDAQNNTVCIWALVDTNQPLVDVSIRIVGTGHQHEDLEFKNYLGTAQTPPYVWHVFKEV